MIQDMAQILMIQSNMLVKIYRQQVTQNAVSQHAVSQHAASQNTNRDFEEDANSSQYGQAGSNNCYVQLRSGMRKPKSDIFRMLKRIMIVESLKVPWLSLLNGELGKIVEDKLV